MASLNVKPSQTNSGPEHRREARKKVLKTARLIWGGGAHGIDCTVLDLSPGGARVGVTSYVSLPDTVFLLDLGSRTAHEAAVVSHHDASVGLKFLRSLKLASITAPELRYLKTAWFKAAT